MNSISVLFSGVLAFGLTASAALACPNLTGNYSGIDNDGFVVKQSFLQTGCDKVEFSSSISGGQIYTVDGKAHVTHSENGYETSETNTWEEQQLVVKDEVRKADSREVFLTIVTRYDVSEADLIHETVAFMNAGETETPSIDFTVGRASR